MLASLINFVKSYRDIVSYLLTVPPALVYFLQVVLATSCTVFFFWDPVLGLSVAVFHCLPVLCTYSYYVHIAVL